MVGERVGRRRDCRAHAPFSNLKQAGMSRFEPQFRAASLSSTFRARPFRARWDALLVLKRFPLKTNLALCQLDDKGYDGVLVGKVINPQRNEVPVQRCT